MERRVLLAIFLAFLVLYVWQAMFVKPVPKPTGAPATTAQEPATGGSNATATPSAPPTAEAPAAPVPAAVLSDATERDVRVETRDVVAVFTNKGARLKSWRLKHYHDKQGQPQELVENHDLLPFTLRTGDAQVDGPLNTALYTVNGVPDAGQIPAPIDLKFEYRDAAGLRAVKEFHLEEARKRCYLVVFHGAAVEGIVVPRRLVNIVIR